MAEPAYKPLAGTNALEAAQRAVETATAQISETARLFEAAAAQVRAKHVITRDQVAAALKQWETDAAANGWTARTDDERHLDQADYVLHTIRLAIGEDGLPKEG